jgi:hypothetical protein
MIKKNIKDMPIGLIEHTSIIPAIWEKIKCPCATSKTGARA